MPRNEFPSEPVNDGVQASPGPSLPARGLGFVLLVAAYLPVHRLLAPDQTGPAGIQTRAAAEAAWMSGLLGSGMIVVVAAMLARLLPRIDVGARGLEVLRRLTHVPPHRFALAVAALTLLQGTLVAWAVHGALPTSVDEMVQLLHARALLAGGITLPMSGPPAAWVTLNAVITDGGWASVYPPFHTLWLALWLAAGAAWLAGPVATAVGAGLMALAVDEVLEDRVAARAGSLLLAFTPYLLLLGGTHLSHATALALLAGVLLAGARARTGGVGWAVAAGAFTGAAVCTRPWVGLTTAAAVLATLWLPLALRRGAAWLGTRAGGLLAGGLPFAGLLFWWNAALFGHPLRLGYTVAFGPSHGLGLHRDPWGNRYGLLEAVGYTGADIVQMGAHLLETPLPALALVGAALLLVPLKRGTGVFLAWTVTGLLANALYWHHGVHMGPRLLFETAPAWIMLWAAGAVALGRPGALLPESVRRTAGWVVTLSLVAAGALAPGIVAAYRTTPGGTDTVPDPPAAEALVFVHGSWSARVASRLAALGMRRDSVETALRRNDICALDRHARDLSAGRLPAAGTVDFDPLPGTPPHLAPRALSTGNVVRMDPSGSWDDACIREARSDRLGSVELESVAWRTTPPVGPVLVVRDLGPALNAQTLEAYPDRSAWIWFGGAYGAPPRLVPYDQGAELLWMGAAGTVDQGEGDVSGAGAGS